MINWEPIGSLAPNFLSYLFWNFFSCHSTRIWVIPALRPPCTFEKYDPYPDFADGVSEAFVVSSLAEGYGIELSFVEVGHGALPLLLTKRFGGFQGILKRTTVKRERRAVSTRTWTFWPSHQQNFIRILANVLCATDKTRNIAAEVSPDQGSVLYNIHSIFNHGS